MPPIIGTPYSTTIAECTDAELEKRIDAQRMLVRRDISRQQQAAQAHAAHVDSEQHAERHGRRADRQLKELEPDDFVDERGATGPDEEQEQGGQPRGRRPAIGRRTGVSSNEVMCRGILSSVLFCLLPPPCASLQGELSRAHRRRGIIERCVGPSH